MAMESTAFILVSEALGLTHARQVAQSGEVFLPISDDNWEKAGDTADLAVGGSVESPSPALFDDPFYFPPSAAQPLPTVADIYLNHAVYLIYVVVLWLHTAFHLPFRTCSALLAIFSLALTAGGAPITPAIHTTLPSAINKLGAEPSIQMLLVCPKCLEVYATSTPKDAFCSKCSHPLFPTNPSPSEKLRSHGSAQNP